MELILCACIGIVFFLCFVFAYREGLRLGMNSAKGREPKPIKNPIKAIKEIVNESVANKELEKQMQAYDNFDKYDGYTELEREWMRGGSRK